MAASSVSLYRNPYTETKPSVGVYVPGGKAAYPSSVLMNVVPAKVAGVKNIIIVTPPKSDGKINKNILL